MNYFYIYKSQGDIVYSLPAIQAYGGGVIITGIPMAQYKALKPLIEIQPGIYGFLHESEIGLPSGFINLEEFRYIQNNPTHIVESFAQILGVKPKWKYGWLAMPKEDYYNDYSAVNITPRYRDKVFNWRKELDFLREQSDEILFLGSRYEFESFSRKYGERKTKYVNSNNWLMTANVIRGAKFFSGTQSCCLAIAEGLGRPYRYERSPFFDNVMTGRQNETIINNNRTRKIHFALSRLQETYRNLLT